MALHLTHWSPNCAPPQQNLEEFWDAAAHYERLINEGRPLPRRRGRGTVVLARRLRPRVPESAGEGAAASQEPHDPSEGSSTDEVSVDGRHRAIEVPEGISLEFKEELGVFFLSTALRAALLQEARQEA